MKKFLSLYKKDLVLVLAIVIAGQLIFSLMSSSFTTPRYEGRIYATTAVEHKSEDLHKLNEAAHYFGQTMIGWLKFPHFLSQLEEKVDLPDSASVSAHIQERQNIIFTVSSSTPLEKETLIGVKDFIQSKIDEYNSVSRTKFMLSNLDYELVEIQRSYQFGALSTLLATLVIGLALVFIRKEFEPKLSV